MLIGLEKNRGYRQMEERLKRASRNLRQETQSKNHGKNCDDERGEKKVVNAAETLDRTNGGVI